MLSLQDYERPGSAPTAASRGSMENKQLLSGVGFKRYGVWALRASLAPVMERRRQRAE
jgi:hypothetical protein